jgi:hypothetical protein
MDYQTIIAMAALVTILGGIFAALKWGRNSLKRIWYFLFRYKPKVPRETIRILPQLRGCRWSNGTVGNKPAMHVIGRWHVTNITGDPVLLLSARLVKPKTEGYVFTRHPEQNMFGRYPVLPGGTTEVDTGFWIVPPVARAGEDFRSTAILIDQYGNEHKIKNVVFSGPRVKEPEKKGPPLESIHTISNPIEKQIVAVLKAETNRYKGCGRRVGGLGSIQTTIRGRTYSGIGTEWREADSPKNQEIIENEDEVVIASDNAQALMNLYASLNIDEKEEFVQFLLQRMSNKTEYAPVGYLILYLLFLIGRLNDALDKAKSDLQGDDEYGFSDALRFLDGLLRFRHSSFSPEMLEHIEKTVEGLGEHTFRISERTSAIRAYRLANKKQEN